VTTINKSHDRILLLFAIFGVLGQIPALLYPPKAYESNIPEYLKPPLSAAKVLLVLLIGLLCAIFAHIMARRELKRVAAAKPSTQVLRRIRQVIFVATSVIVLACILLAIYAMSALEFTDYVYPRDTVINNLYGIAADAYQHRTRSIYPDSGLGTYRGYAIPKILAARLHEDAPYFDYRLVYVHPDTIEIEGRYVFDALVSAVRATLDSTGRLSNWRYSGGFE
jgi:hypothetical protein